MLNTSRGGVKWEHLICLIKNKNKKAVTFEIILYYLFIHEDEPRRFSCGEGFVWEGIYIQNLRAVFV